MHTVSLRYIAVAALLVSLAGGVMLFRKETSKTGRAAGWICQEDVWVAQGASPGPSPSVPCATETLAPSIQQESNDIVSLYFQPKQCQQMSWDEWHASVGAVFDSVNSPSEEEIVQNYYAQQGIRIHSVTKVESDQMVCQACDVCATSYSFKIEAPREQVGKLTLAGWMLLEESSQKSRYK